MVSLATQRGLLLIGEPGTAKSMLSELLAAAISGDSTLTIQGGAATAEEQIKYGWGLFHAPEQGAGGRGAGAGAVPSSDGDRQAREIRGDHAVPE